MERALLMDLVGKADEKMAVEIKKGMSFVEASRKYRL